MFYGVMLLSGALWTLAYLLILRQGYLDRTYGMPLAALGANISWEFVFSFVYPPHSIQHPVNIVWFCLDLLIVLQTLGFGPREFPDLSRPLFYATFALMVAIALPTIILMSRTFGDYDGAYSAFGQNLMMSALFIAMLYNRRSLRGQSLPIALCKLFGTAAASFAFYFYSTDYSGSPLLTFLYLAIFALDLLYTLLVLAATRMRPAGKAPTRRAHTENRSR
ncbi:MAG: hypothetical protein K6T51_07285 [Rubrobacteraceae bacterium]|uniref:transmembrane-type terpene cyclase n=1 Tax=Rubrobacter naiadicus TaxID=1392641 RepID=UPI0023627283|nr:hypothetical protein [Rubrobacter naiadicus]MBX6762877.1 hypothetical protein [Rubrobacteraceae bacterium]MCL6438397.1 hypothetical protein [Rubrobacteraceae bacterium]